MPQNIKLIRAFMASPGGLDEERRVARAAAEEINATVARNLGYRLELLGWEDTISGVGRPQSLINAELESCELFIGAMWTRWGTPPSTDGPYTSGFEEEFELSHRRWRETGAPAMAIFFKDINQQQRSDPGPELQKVLAFRQRLIDEKLILFEPFLSSEEFAQKIRRFLSTQVLKRHLADTEADSEGEESAREIKQPSTATSTSNPSLEERGEEAEFLRHLADRLRIAQERERLSAVEVARLRLVGAALSRSGNDAVYLGVHDANLIYASRAELSLAWREIVSLLACALYRHVHENVPLWTWLSNLQQRHSEALITYTLVGAEDERIGAFKVMRLIGQRLRDDGVFGHPTVSRWFAENVSTKARAAALNYLRDFGTAEDLDAIRTELARATNETSAPAIEAIFAIELKTDERKAVISLLNSSFERLAADVLHLALQKMDLLRPSELAGGLDHRSPQVRARALELLMEAGQFDAAITQRAAEDESALVRLAALRVMDGASSSPTLDEAFQILDRPKPSAYGLFGLRSVADPEAERLFAKYRIERLAKASTEEVQRLANSNTAHRDAARIALAGRRFDEMADDLRRDIDDNFVSYVAERWPEGLAPKRRTAFSGLLSFTGTAEEEKQRELMGEAIDLLATKDEDRDLPRIRSAVTNGKIRPSTAVIDYLRRHGGWEDIPRLATNLPTLSLALTSDTDHESLMLAAARAILALASGRTSELLQVAMPNSMLALIIKILPNSHLAGVDDIILERMLHHDDTQVRRAVAMKCVLALSKKRLSSLHSTYMTAEENRYYNAIHWLDLGLAMSRQVARGIIARARSS